jgi:leader peptidase (prepilin peptidase)/N-methyltransferase
MDYLQQLPQGFLAFSVFLFGLTFGSFANVCIYRMPRQESTVHPRSHCPSCNHFISAWENIPVISYALLGGKCRSCKQPISIIYPVIEVMTALILTGVFLRFGLTLEFLIFSIVAGALVIITAIDLEHKIIPDLITLPGIIFGLIAGTYLIGWQDSLFGFLLGGGLFYAIAVLSNGGMGGGDIKFIAGAGALIGWKKVLIVIFIGSLLGSIIGLAMIPLLGKNRKSQIPFGPFLAAGLLIVIFMGDKLIQLYIDLFMAKSMGY